MTTSKRVHYCVVMIAIFMMIMVLQPSVVHSRMLLQSSTSTTKHENTAVSGKTNEFVADTKVPVPSDSSRNTKDNPVGDGQVYTLASGPSRRGAGHK